MLIKKSAFSDIAKVSRQIVYRLVDEGQLVANADGLLDTDNAINRSYIMRHNASALQHLQANQDATDPPAITPTKSPRKKTVPQPIPQSPAPPQGPTSKRRKPTDDSASLLARIAAAQDEADIPDGLSPSEMKIVLKRAYYETSKIKNDAEKRAIEIDRLNDLLVEKEIVIEYLTELSQSIQRNFIDSDTKQAVTICAALGAIGHENDVIEILAEDNGRRIEDAKRLADKAVRKKHNVVRADDEAADDGAKDEDE